MSKLEHILFSVSVAYGGFLESICALVVSHFGFEGWTLVLITSVPGHCLPFTISDYDCP